MTSSAASARRVLGASLLAATATLAAACSSSGSGSSSSATVTVTPPSSATATSPTPTAASSQGPATPSQCTTAGLRVSKGTSSAAAGTTYARIDFTNTAGSTCVLEGYPGVSLVSGGSNAGSQVGADAKRITTTPVHPITLAAGQTAHAELGVADAGNFPAGTCNPVTAHWLKVFPPNQRAAAYVPFSTQTCASTAQPTLTISAISTGR